MTPVKVSSFMLWSIRHLGLAAPALVAAVLALVFTPHGRLLAGGPLGALDQPVGTAPVSGVVDVTGWAIDTTASDGTGVDRVTIVLDDANVKSARYGQPRPDIAGAFGPAFAASGFEASLDIESLAPPGDHILEVRFHSSVADTWTSVSQPLQVLGAPRFGVNTHLLWYGLNHVAADLDRTRASGLSVIRFDLNWDDLEPNAHGDWNQAYLARMDDVVELLANRGLHPIVTIVRTPPWARTGGTAMSPPDDPHMYADAVGMLATRYAHVPGMTYEIWNEPNSPVFWDTPEGPDAVRYTALLRAAYAQIKAAAPGATVLGGSIVFNDSDYLNAMLGAGAGNAFDGLSLHPYSRGFAPDDVSMPSRSFSLAISTAQQLLAEQGLGTTPIWITEMGWSTSQVSDTQRADFYRRAVQIVRANPQIVSFCAFQLNQADDSTGPETGLILPNGTPTASWAAYGQALSVR